MKLGILIKVLAEYKLDEIFTGDIKTSEFFRNLMGMFMELPVLIKKVNSIMKRKIIKANLKHLSTLFKIQ